MGVGYKDKLLSKDVKGGAKNRRRQKVRKLLL